MSERTDGRRPASGGGEDFEGYLFGQIESGQLDFPKALLQPLDEARPERGSAHPLLRRLAGLAGSSRRLLLTPAVAYALVLALAVPAYRGLFPGPEPAAPRAASAGPAARRVGTARLLDLGAGPTRGRAAEPVLELREGDAFVAISFLAPVRSGRSYQAALAGDRGRTLAVERPLRGDGLGSFVLVCDGALFREGDYVLTVSEVAPEAGPPAEEFHFPFRVVRPSH